MTAFEQSASIGTGKGQEEKTALRSHSRWLAILTPSFSDCFCLAVLFWLFLAGSSGWKALLMDGDTGWHIRTGEYVLSHGRIPTRDLYSFSRVDAPWFAWEWLSDVVFGCLFRWAGLKAVVLFSGVLIACFSTVLLRFALWRGANVMAAVPLTLLAIGASTIHFLARPHLFTLLLLPSALWVLERDRRRRGKAVWLLIPLTALWTNLHGGFAVFLASLGLIAAGLAVESWLGPPNWNQVRRYSILLAGCLAATLVNPFGPKLHRHIFEYLRADWIRNMVQEFQAPTFRSEGQLEFEILLIAGLMLCAWLLANRRAADAFLLVFLAHSALTSARHAPLFAAAAAPLLAEVLTELWRRSTASNSGKSIGRILFQIGEDLKPAFRRQTAWPAFAVAALACAGSPVAWPLDFPREAFPVELLHRYEKILSGRRVFTSDQWADYLIYSLPGQKVFFDGRSDFYGERLSREYLALMQGEFSSARLLDRYVFDYVLVPVNCPLAELLKHRPGWTLLEDDHQAVLFSAGAARVTLPPPARTKANETAPHGRTV